jgi:hypothetical protein
MPGCVKQGRLPRAADDDDELVTVIPGIPTTRIADLPSSVLDPTFYDYEPYLKSSVVTLKAAGVLINTFYDPEPRNIDVLQTTLYGGSDSNGQVMRFFKLAAIAQISVPSHRNPLSVAFGFVFWSSCTDSASGSNVATCIFHRSSFQSWELRWRSSSYYCAEDEAPGPPNNRSRAMLTVAMEAASSFSPCLLGPSKLSNT